MNLGELIAARRAQSSMSLQEVADACGCSKGHLHDIEHGRNPNITLRLAVRLSLCLGIPVSAMAAATLEDTK